MQSALRSYARAVETEIDRYTRDVTDAGLRDELGRAMKPGGVRYRVDPL